MKPIHLPLVLVAGFALAAFSTPTSRPDAEFAIPSGNEFGVNYDNLQGTNYVFNSSHLIQDAFALLALEGTYHVEGSIFQIAMEMSVLGLALWLEGWTKRMTTLEPKPAARAA